MPKPVYAIVAVSRGRVIGRAGRLPWVLPRDTAYFLECTRDGVMIEGPGCYAELGGALPDRDTIVISRDSGKTFPGALRAADLESALQLAQVSTRPGPVWISGGQWLYEAALPLCDRLYVTEIDADFAGDRFFPEWRKSHPVLFSSRDAEDSGVSLKFRVYSRAWSKSAELGA